MKRLLLSLLAFPALTTLVSAQPAAAAPPVAAVDSNRIKALQKQADAAQKEVDAITSDLRKTDARIASSTTGTVYKDPKVQNYSVARTPLNNYCK